MVVFVICFAQMAQVFVIVGSGQIIAFISRDLGDADLAGWIIREPQVFCFENVLMLEQRDRY